MNETFMHQNETLVTLQKKKIVQLFANNPDMYSYLAGHFPTINPPRMIEDVFELEVILEHAEEVDAASFSAAVNGEYESRWEAYKRSVVNGQGEQILHHPTEDRMMTEIEVKRQIIQDIITDFAQGNFSGTGSNFDTTTTTTTTNESGGSGGDESGRVENFQEAIDPELFTDICTQALETGNPVVVEINGLSIHYEYDTTHIRFAQGLRLEEGEVADLASADFKTWQMVVSAADEFTSFTALVQRTLDSGPDLTLEDRIKMFSIRFENVGVDLEQTCSVLRDVPDQFGFQHPVNDTQLTGQQAADLMREVCTGDRPVEDLPVDLQQRARDILKAEGVEDLVELGKKEIKIKLKPEFEDLIKGAKLVEYGTGAPVTGSFVGNYEVDDDGVLRDVNGNPVINPNTNTDNENLSPLQVSYDANLREIATSGSVEAQHLISLFNPAQNIWIQNQMTSEELERTITKQPFDACITAVVHRGNQAIEGLSMILLRLGFTGINDSFNPSQELINQIDEVQKEASKSLRSTAVASNEENNLQELVQKLAKVFLGEASAENSSSTRSSIWNNATVVPKDNENSQPPKLQPVSENEPSIFRVLEDDGSEKQQEKPKVRIEFSEEGQGGESTPTITLQKPTQPPTPPPQPAPMPQSLLSSPLSTPKPLSTSQPQTPSSDRNNNQQQPPSQMPPVSPLQPTSIPQPSSQPTPTPLPPIRNTFSSSSGQPNQEASTSQPTSPAVPTRRGRFAKAEPTIVAGQDLDSPTVYRKGFQTGKGLISGPEDVDTFLKGKLRRIG